MIYRLRKNERGVGMVEVLVAVVIVSIGFLAAASMQVQGMRFSQGAYFQSQAYFMASDIIDRMRNNTRAVTENLYDNKETAADLADPGCNTGSCTYAQMVRQDLFEWSAALHSKATGFTPLLPSSTEVPALGKIDKIADNQYRITLTWAETINGQSKAQNLTVNFAVEQYETGN